MAQAAIGPGHPLCCHADVNSEKFQKLQKHIKSQISTKEFAISRHVGLTNSYRAIAYCGSIRFELLRHITLEKRAGSARVTPPFSSGLRGQGEPHCLNYEQSNIQCSIYSPNARCFQWPVIRTLIGFKYFRAHQRSFILFFGRYINLTNDADAGAFG